MTCNGVYGSWCDRGQGCEQQRRWPVRAYLCLGYSPIEKHHIWTCFKPNFNFPASLRSWASWFESHCQKPRKPRLSHWGPYIFFYYFRLFMIRFIRTLPTTLENNKATCLNFPRNTCPDPLENHITKLQMPKYQNTAKHLRTGLICVRQRC